MELRIKPTNHNKYPLSGILIKGQSVLQWVQAIQGMGLSLEASQVYVIPGPLPNSVWGCLVETAPVAQRMDIGANAYCQLAYQLLYLPERSDVFPAVTAEEMGRLFLQKKHVFHPDFGWVELSECIDWATVLVQPPSLPMSVVQPQLAPYMPKEIRAFQVYMLDKATVLKNMEDNLFPSSEPLDERPLNAFERGKYYVLKKMLGADGKGGGAAGGDPSMLEKLGLLLFGKESALEKRMRQDLDALERRNQKKLDRLLDLLKNDPMEALKYAIPLDMDGTSRGSSMGEMSLDKRWGDLSLFGSGLSRGGGGGGAALGVDGFAQLQQQYHNTANQLIQQKEYMKAAFVYMKLLKNYPMAAQTLENGKHYAEAAAMYLDFVKNKNKAAECYEKGNMTREAIALYKELELNEKAGDLYLRIHEKPAAMEQYGIVLERYKAACQYVKASIFCKTKMDDANACQDLLLEGWRKNQDAFNCLNNYFVNIQAEKTLGEQIETVYAKDVHADNRTVFLKVLQYEFDRNKGLRDPIKSIAHEIIVAEAPRNPAIVQELRTFGKEDKQLLKDTLRFRG